MIVLPFQEIQVLFLTFCRIGGCLMLMPGYSSTRIPMQVRLFIAFAATLAISPMVFSASVAALANLKSANYFAIIATELGLGILIGLLGRCFFLALQFMAVGVANFIGLGTLPGAPTLDNEPSPPIASLIMLTATMMLFVTNQHIEILFALLESYSAVPLASGLDAALSLNRLANILSESFQLALQVCSPFIVFAIVVNFMFGLVNKMTPQIPVYFISLPFVILGGLFLSYATLMEFLLTFFQGFSDWLARA